MCDARCSLFTSVKLPPSTRAHSLRRFSHLEPFDDPALLARYQDISRSTPYFREMKRDGNSMFRVLTFALIESLKKNAQEDLLVQFFSKDLSQGPELKGLPDQNSPQASRKSLMADCRVEVQKLVRSTSSDIGARLSDRLNEQSSQLDNLLSCYTRCLADALSPQLCPDQRKQLLTLGKEGSPEFLLHLLQTLKLNARLETMEWSQTTSGPNRKPLILFYWREAFSILYGEDDVTLGERDCPFAIYGSSVFQTVYDVETKRIPVSISSYETPLSESHKLMSRQDGKKKKTSGPPPVQDSLTNTLPFRKKPRESQFGQVCESSDLSKALQQEQSLKQSSVNSEQGSPHSIEAASQIQTSLCIKDQQSAKASRVKDNSRLIFNGQPSRSIRVQNSADRACSQACGKDQAGGLSLCELSQRSDRGSQCGLKQDNISRFDSVSRDQPQSSARNDLIEFESQIRFQHGSSQYSSHSNPQPVENSPTSFTHDFALTFQGYHQPSVDSKLRTISEDSLEATQRRSSAAGDCQQPICTDARFRQSISAESNRHILQQSRDFKQSRLKKLQSRLLLPAKPQLFSSSEKSQGLPVGKSQSGNAPDLSKSKQSQQFELQQSRATLQQFKGPGAPHTSAWGRGSASRDGVKQFGLRKSGMNESFLKQSNLREQEQKSESKLSDMKESGLRQFELEQPGLDGSKVSGLNQSHQGQTHPFVQKSDKQRSRQSQMNTNRQQASSSKQTPKRPDQPASRSSRPEHTSNQSGVGTTNQSGATGLKRAANDSSISKRSGPGHTQRHSERSIQVSQSLAPYASSQHSARNESSIQVPFAQSRHLESKPRAVTSCQVQTSFQARAISAVGSSCHVCVSQAQRRGTTPPSRCSFSGRQNNPTDSLCSVLLGHHSQAHQLTSSTLKSSSLAVSKSEISLGSSWGSCNRPSSSVQRPNLKNSSVQSRTERDKSASIQRQSHKTNASNVDSKLKTNLPISRQNSKSKSPRQVTFEKSPLECSFSKKQALGSALIASKNQSTTSSSSQASSASISAAPNLMNKSSATTFATAREPQNYQVPVQFRKSRLQAKRQKGQSRVSAMSGSGSAGKQNQIGRQNSINSSVSSSKAGMSSSQSSSFGLPTQLRLSEVGHVQSIRVQNFQRSHPNFCKGRPARQSIFEPRYEDYGLGPSRGRGLIR